MKYLLKVAAVCTLCLAVPFPALAMSTDQWIDQELIRLQDSPLDSATLSLWSQRLDKAPDHLRLRADYAILLTRAGELDQALAIARHLSWQHYPAYFIEAMASALGRAGRNDEALPLLRLGLRRYPDNPGLHATLIITLSNQPETLNDARRYAEYLPDDQRNSVAMQTALGWLAAQQGLYALAAEHYRKARTPDNDHPWLFHQELTSLQRTGLHQQARDIAEQRRAWLSDEQYLTVIGDQAAWQYRLALAEDRGTHWYDNTLSTLNEHCMLAQQLDDRSELQRCESTRIRLMSSRGDHRGATDHYQRHLNPPSALDQEAHLAALDSYLALSDLRSAQDAATRVDPLPVEQQATLLMLSERPREARALLEQERAEQPIWIWGAHSDRSHPNHDRLALEQEIARSLAWEGRLAESQQMLMPLHQAAPRHTGLRLQLAELYRWRGWPDRADQEYDLIEAMEPISPALHRARFAAEMDRRAWHQADHHRQHIEERTLPPAQPTGEQQRWHTATGPWLSAGTRYGRGASSLDPSANRSLSSYAEIYSPAWTRFDDSRTFIRHSQIYDRQSGVRQRLERLYLGITSGHRDREIELAWVKRLSNHDSAINVRGGYRLNDHWRLDGHWQGDSDGTPLRAASNNIDLRSTQLALSYSVESGHQYRGYVNDGRYSDGNRNLNVGLSGRQPLYRRGPHQWALHEDWSWTRNSEQNTPYYSPERAMALGVRLEYQGVLHALMARRWSHRAQIGTGLLNEQDAGNSLTWQAEYGHQWQLNRHLSVAGSAGVSSREYAGDREQEVNVQASLVWRWL
jgi:biofilm PGA synthesis protein PgaA